MSLAMSARTDRIADVIERICGDSEWDETRAAITAEVREFAGDYGVIAADVDDRLALEVLSDIWDPGRADLTSSTGWHCFQLYVATLASGPTGDCVTANTWRGDFTIHAM